VTTHKESDAYKSASGGWGSIKAITHVLFQEHIALDGSRVLMHQNKPDGFMWVSCSWAKPKDPHTFEFCESGAKATAWDLTSKRVDPDFFAHHTVSALNSWHDHELEEAGRLAAPLRWDSATDRYLEVSWEDAFAEIGRELNALEPNSAVFYTSGRASLETACMYQLFARMYGTNAVEYGRAHAVIAHYGMGLTQHRMGVQNVRILMNLLLMRGNMGKPGAGPSPVRGHSNVQGQRTVGITEKPELAPLDKLAEQCRFEPPRDKGMNTVEACEAIVAGKVRALFQLGGNLVRSVPDRSLIEPAWSELRLTVNITTKLNRSHLIHGEISYVLPCLSRIEIDERAGKVQAVSTEDSTGCMHGSRGVAKPASDKLRSEPKIVAGIAKATLGPASTVDWNAWANDYASVRDAIAETYPKIFQDFNARMWTPGGFHRPLPAAERKWETKSGKAALMTPDTLFEDPDVHGIDENTLRLFTLRSDSQFNTTIYNLDDRFRGVHGSRMVLLMNKGDIDRFGLSADQEITLETVADDGVERRVGGLKIKSFDLPAGCVGGYYPECNPLLPLWHYAKQSKVPAAKSVPVRIVA
jgi:molybdopterin-dependent oxidoreductase alpha subunit